MFIYQTVEIYRHVMCMIDSSTLPTENVLTLLENIMKIKYDKIRNSLLYFYFKLSVLLTKHYLSIAIIVFIFSCFLSYVI